MEPHGQSPCLYTEVPCLAVFLDKSYGTQAWYLHEIPSYAPGR